MTKLKIADALSLPVDTVTQTIAVVAKRRAGKSYLARRLTEQLFQAGQQVVIADPKGDWWGVRSAADGKGPGLPIVILGGERGDVKLEPGGGEVVAKLVVEERVSALLDLSLLRKHEVATFMTAFLESLYRLKAREVYRTPVMLVIDEADAIAPQKPQPNEARMLGAAEDIVRRGGQRGIGCTLITQRTAVLNKNVLTQAQVLIALRTIAPQDLKAMNAWIDVHGEEEQRATLMESLPALPVGDAWVWSPGWPTVDGVFKRIRTLPIETFDSGATPKPGERRTEPKTVAEVDLAAISRQMADTIERAKADDPLELRKRIAELEKAARAKPASAAAPRVERIEVPILTKEESAALRAIGIRLERDAKDLAALLRAAEATRGLFARLERHLEAPPREPPRRPIPTPTASPKQRERAERHLTNGSSEVGHGGLRRIMVALAQRPHGLTNRQIGVRAGLSSRSGTFSTYISRARSAGWIDGTGTVRITDAGLEALGAYEPLPTGADLANHWLGELGSSGAARILRALIDAYPQSLTHDRVGELADISPRSGTYSTYVSRLRSLELIEGRSELRASEELFS
jgi:hypothetical protein